MPSLHDLIFHALDNAVENGYGKFVCDADPMTVAQDLAECDADIERSRAKLGEITERVIQWRAARWADKYRRQS